VFLFFRRCICLLTKEEIKKKLEEDQSYTLPDDATDEDWDTYLEVKREMSGEEDADENNFDESEDNDEEEDTEEEL